jgi:hypothetical protein
MALNQQRLSQCREAVGLTRKSLAQRHRDQTEVWLCRAEFEELIRPPLARIVEASRSDIKTTAAPVPTVESRGLAGSNVRAPTQVPQRPSRTTVAPGSADVRERAPRRFTQFAAAGVLALVGGAASVPLLTSHSGSIATTTVENPAPAAPAAAIPALKVGNGPHGEGSTGAPVAAPNKPADSPAPAAAAVAVRTPQSVRSTSRSRPAGSLRAQPAPRGPEIPPEVYAAWSRMAALGASDQDRSRLRPAASPHS